MHCIRCGASELCISGIHQAELDLAAAVDWITVVEQENVALREQLGASNAMINNAGLEHGA